MQNIIDFIFSWMSFYKPRARVVAYSHGVSPYMVEYRQSLLHPWKFDSRANYALFALKRADELNKYGTVQVVER